MARLEHVFNICTWCFADLLVIFSVLNKTFCLIIPEIRYHSTRNHRRIRYVSSSSQRSHINHLLLPEEEPWASLRCKEHEFQNTQSLKIHLIAQWFPCWVSCLVCRHHKSRVLRRSGPNILLTSVVNLRGTKSPWCGQYMESCGYPHLAEPGLCANECQNYACLNLTQNKDQTHYFC